MNAESKARQHQIINAILTVALIGSFLPYQYMLRRITLLEAETSGLKSQLAWQEQAGMTAVVYRRKAHELERENKRLQAENWKLAEGLETIRKTGKSRGQMVREGLIVLPGQYERAVPSERQR